MFGKGRENQRPILGTGVFVISETLESGLTVSIKHDMTYCRCRKQGQRYLAYKWVAFAVWEAHRRAAGGGRGRSAPALEDHSEAMGFDARSKSVTGATDHGTLEWSAAATAAGLTIGLDEHGCTPCEVWNARKGQCEKVRVDC